MPVYNPGLTGSGAANSRRMMKKKKPNESSYEPAPEKLPYKTGEEAQEEQRDYEENKFKLRNVLKRAKVWGHKLGLLDYNKSFWD